MSSAQSVRASARTRRFIEGGMPLLDSSKDEAPTQAKRVGQNMRRAPTVRLRAYERGLIFERPPFDHAA